MGAGQQLLPVMVPLMRPAKVIPLPPQLFLTGRIQYMSGQLTLPHNTTAEANYASDSFTVTVDGSLRGDANGDGAVNALDITKVERIIAGLDAQTAGADANQDGNVNALDITKVERIIALHLEELD